MSAPNVLLLVLDAVRSDHLSCYGHDRETTPNVDRLAREGLRFENAFANSNWTGASHAAMFTGLLPSESGVHGDDMTLPGDVQTLAEGARDAGYRTFATSAGLHVTGERGYDRGFDRFHDTYRARPSADFAGTLLRDPSARRQLLFSATRGHDNYTRYKADRFDRWLEAGEEPFFAFMNWTTAHNPYDPPRPYKSLFCDELDRPRYEFLERALAALGRDGESLASFDVDRLRELSWDYPVVAGEMEPTRAELDVVRAWYDGAIRYLDDRLGEILGRLEERSLLEDTYVIVTADHGELFGEHGLEKHHYSLYEELLRVPLVVRPPSGESAVRTDPVSLVDLYPTVLDVCGASAPDRDLAASLVSGDEGARHEHLFAEVGRKSDAPITRRYPDFDGSDHEGPLQSVRDDEYKLIAHPDGRRELYRWRDDRAEQEDLAAREQEVVERLEGVLERNLGSLRDAVPDLEAADDDRQDRLEDLGYL